MKVSIPKIHHILFGCIIVLALVLRLYQLGNVPVSPDWDEVSLGYNAYSILQTGRDEFGRFLPPIIESFGDFKPALYMYLTVPSIAAFGLNVFATRLPSAVLGVLAVIATYFLADELFKKKELALLSSFLLAISPWSLQFSRVAIESNVGDALNIFVVLFFVKGLKKSRYLYLSAIFAALNLYVYQSEKAFTPLLVLLLIVIFYKKLATISKKTLAGVVITGLLVTLPTVLFIMQNQNALTRLGAVNVFSESFYTLQTNVKEQVQDHKNNDKIGILLDNRRFVYLYMVLHSYLSHFDPNWWFVKGDFTTRHQAPEMSHLYIFEAPFLFIGLYCLFFLQLFDRRSKYLLLGWFFLAPIPASITVDVPHAVRTLNFLPTFQIFTAIGCWYAYAFIKTHTTKSVTRGYIGVVILLFLINFIFYLDHYFVQYNYFSSKDWQYGYTQLIPYIQEHKGEYKKIIVSRAVPLDQSYMYFLFYLQYPPEKWQAIESKIGHYTVDHAFDIFEFRRFNIDEVKKGKKGELYVIGFYDSTDKLPIVKSIYFLNGEGAMKVVKGIL